MRSGPPSLLPSLPALPPTRPSLTSEPACWSGEEMPSPQLSGRLWAWGVCSPRRGQETSPPLVRDMEQAEAACTGLRPRAPFSALSGTVTHSCALSPRQPCLVLLGTTVTDFTRLGSQTEPAEDPSPQPWWAHHSGTG